MPQTLHSDGESDFRGRRKRSYLPSADYDRILLQELTHRVHDDLQLLASFVSLKRRRTAQPEALDSLGDLQDRISAFGAVYALLRPPFGPQLAVNLGSYLARLCRGPRCGY